MVPISFVWEANIYKQQNCRRYQRGGSMGSRGSVEARCWEEASLSFFADCVTNASVRRWI
jgi:hypothetical protein